MNHFQCVGLCFQYLHAVYHLIGLSRWHNGKESTFQCKRHRRLWTEHWVGKIPRRRKWQPTPVSLPGKSQGQRSLTGYSPWGCKESDMTEHIRTWISFNSDSPMGRHSYYGHLIVKVTQVERVYLVHGQPISKWWRKTYIQVFLTPIPTSCPCLLAYVTSEILCQ